MIKVKTILLDPKTKTAEVSLFADTKGEVGGASVEDIEGFPKDQTIGFGSMVMSAAGEFAFMKSDGSWTWI